MSDPKLARNWPKSRVLQTHDAKQTHELVRFLRARYTERFFEPIRCLKRAPGNVQGYGFAVMSLCCLLIETLQCYRLGWPSSHPSDLSAWAKLPLNKSLPDPDYELRGPFDNQTIASSIAFESFFSDPKHRPFFPNVSGSAFYQQIRCGLLHQAQTKGGWRIVRSGSYWDDTAGQKAINRDEFSQRLEDCFAGFLKELEGGGWDQDPWKNTRKKLWWLAQTS